MRMRKFAVALAGLLALPSAPAIAGDVPDNLIAPGDFDFYVLTLSWSPGFCDTGGEEKSPDQCSVGSGQGFVVHGLWPDNFNRRYPDQCGAADEISAQALRETRGVYPAEGLARYEYRKHGTCTGLTPEDYFAAVKFARDRFAIPAMLQAPRAALTASPNEIENAFIAANPNLTGDNMAVTCQRGELIDVRFCIAKTLDGFVDCPKIARHTCHSRAISVSPLR